MIKRNHLYTTLHSSTGATGLHLAIAYGNDEIAQEIIAVSNEGAINALVNTVASGKNFYQFTYMSVTYFK